MKNVCLVITYFGKWPPWIDFFIRRTMKGWSVQWDSGKLYDMSQQKEIMYYHFLLSTKTKTFYIPPFSPDISHFTITRDGIAPDTPGTVEFL